MPVKPIPIKDIPKFLEKLKNGIDMLDPNYQDNINSWTGINKTYEDERKGEYKGQEQITTKEEDEIALFVALEYVEKKDEKLLGLISHLLGKIDGVIYGLLLAEYLEESENGLLIVSEIGKKKLEELRPKVLKNLKI